MTTYTIIKAGSLVETIAIIHTESSESSSSIRVTATSSDVTHVIQHKPDHGLAVDFSGLKAPACTMILTWTRQASHPVRVEYDPKVRKILDRDNPTHKIEHACDASELVCSLFLPLYDNLSKWGPDPKIKIIPPSCS